MFGLTNPIHQTGIFTNIEFSNCWAWPTRFIKLVYLHALKFQNVWLDQLDLSNWYIYIHWIYKMSKIKLQSTSKQRNRTRDLWLRSRVNWTNSTHRKENYEDYIMVARCDGVHGVLSTKGGNGTRRSRGCNFPPGLYKTHVPQITACNNCFVLPW